MSSQIAREQALEQVVSRYQSIDGDLSESGSRMLTDALFREAVFGHLRGGDKQAPGELTEALRHFESRLLRLLGFAPSEAGNSPFVEQTPSIGRPTFVKTVWQKLELEEQALLISHRARFLFYSTLHCLIEAVLPSLTSDNLHTLEPAAEALADGEPAIGPETSDDPELTPEVEPTGEKDRTDSNAPEGEDLAIGEHSLASQQAVYHAVWETFALEFAICAQRHEVAQRNLRVLRDTNRHHKQLWLTEELRERLQEEKGVTYDDGLQFAATMTHLVIECMDERWFTLAQMGRTRTKKIVPTPAFLRRVKKLSDDRLVLQRNAPLVEPPKDWGEWGIRHGAFHWRTLPFYKFHWKNQRIRDFLQAVDGDEGLNAAFAAANALQQTAWQINLRVWAVVEQLYAISGVSVTRVADAELFPRGLGTLADRVRIGTSRPSRGIDSLQDLMPEESKQEVKPSRATFSKKDWRAWLKQSFYSRSGRHAKGPGARAATRVALSTLLDAIGKRIYFAYQADSRGRLYPVSGILNPQGDDLNRALLEFADAKPLSGDGVRYLAIHGSQQIQSSTILDHFDDRTRPAPTLDQRVKWIEAHSPEILASARDPLGHPWWRAAKSPFMFLAFCFAWADYQEKGPDVPLRLPIHVDGTCNGLQHIAAITRDEELARATCVLPLDDPRDIYSEVAAEVRRRILSLPSPAIRRKNGKSQGAATDGALQFAIDFFRTRQELIDRSMAKEVVMIIPYGAGLSNYQGVIGKALVRRLARESSTDEPTPEEAFFESIPDRDQWAPVEMKFKSEAHRRRACLASWLTKVCARHVAEHFSEVLDVKFPAIHNFKRRLSTSIEPVLRQGIPVMWVAPSGLPVLQDAFKLTRHDFDVKVLDHRLRYVLRHLKDDISKQGQRTGILPNFIHSVDASHLVRTVNLARSRGVTSVSCIHDSFGTHACDMAVLSQCIRDAFVETHPPGIDRLAAFEVWCDKLAAAAAHSDGEQRTNGSSTLAGKLLDLAQKWGSGAHEGAVAKRGSESPSGFKDDWIERVRDSEYFFM